MSTIAWFILSGSSSMMQSDTWSELWLGLGETSSDFMLKFCTEFTDPSWHKMILLAPQVSLLFPVVLVLSVLLT